MNSTHTPSDPSDPSILPRKTKHPSKRKPNRSHEYNTILIHVGKLLYDHFRKECNEQPLVYLVDLKTKDPVTFHDNYMAWKFASNFTPAQHRDMDAILRQLDAVPLAVDAVIQYSLDHKKLSIQDLDTIHDLELGKEDLAGGAKNKKPKSTKKTRAQQLVRAKYIKAQKARSIRRSRTQTLLQTEPALPGKEGFNEFIGKIYAKQIDHIRQMEMVCAKSNSNFWTMEPYQAAAVFLGSPSCLFTKNLLVVHRTGSGKTGVINNLLSSYIHDDRVKLFLTPNRNIRDNFYSQITQFDTPLAKYVNTFPQSAHELLTFHDKCPKPYRIRTYKHMYLNRVMNATAKVRKRIADEVFGDKPWLPHAPTRSIIMDEIVRLYEPISKEEFPEFVEKLRINEPCVTPKDSGQKLNALATLRPDYGYDAKARELLGHKVRNPFNNRVIVIDEADRLFKEMNDIRKRMFIYLLQYARNTVVIGLTATPLVEGDEEYSEDTCKLLELIKGVNGSDPLASSGTARVSNEGYISYYYSLIPPFDPVIIPDISHSLSDTPTLGRIVFSTLTQGNRSRYTEAVKQVRGVDPTQLLTTKYARTMMGYANSKYLDRSAKRKDILKYIVENFEQNSNKLSCLYSTLMQENCQSLKTVVLFTEGLETFRAYIQHKHPDMYFDLVQGQSASPNRIGFVTHTDPNKSRMLKEFNRDTNLYGKSMRVICADRNFTIGVDFRGARRLILVSPPVDASLYIQYIGRVLRLCTYSKLPEDKRNVRIDIMVATLDPKRTLAQIEQEDAYTELMAHHTQSATPVLTIDEVALRVLLQDVQNYRERMDRIFQKQAIDAGWVTIPVPDDVSSTNDLETRCGAEGVQAPNDPNDPNDPNGMAMASWNPNSQYSNSNSNSHTFNSSSTSSSFNAKAQENSTHSKWRHTKNINKAKKAGKHRAIGRKRKDMPNSYKGIGVPQLQRPLRQGGSQFSLDDEQEMTLAESKFRSLAIPGINESEFARYQKVMRVPNMAVTTFVYTSAKEIPTMYDAMRMHPNSLMLARDNFKSIDFGKNNHFEIEVLVAEAAKKWENLAAYYNKYFVGHTMKEWKDVLWINLYYLKFKNRVYLQYEPNIQVVRPVLFVNMKAWIESLGDKKVSTVDFHKLYQDLPEFRSNADRVRIKNNPRPLKLNPDGSVDIVAEINVPDLQRQDGQILTGNEVLREPQAYHMISEVYSTILQDYLGVVDSQIVAHRDSKGYLIMNIYRVDNSQLDDELEYNLVVNLLNPDPNWQSPIDVKASAYDDQVHEYYLLPRTDVTLDTLSNYLRFAKGTNLPKRVNAFQRSPSDKWEDGQKKRSWKDPFPSSKEILNTNDGNVWIMVQKNGFKIHATSTLPTNPVVDPYRTQVAFQKAKEQHKLWVLLDQIQPWQMTTTRSVASIKQFALRSTEKEWSEFWEACLKIKKSYESQHGQPLFVYTDALPSLAHFHVNFSIHKPHEQSKTHSKKVKKKVAFANEVPRSPSSPLSSSPTINAYVEKELVSYSPSNTPCASVGHEIAGLVFNVHQLYGKRAFMWAKVLIMFDPLTQLYTLPTTSWKQDKTPKDSLQEYLKTQVAPTTNLGLSDAESTDFTNTTNCARILMMTTLTPWTLYTKQAEWVPIQEFWTLQPRSLVLEATHQYMQLAIEAYLDRVDNM